MNPVTECPLNGYARTKVGARYLENNTWQCVRGQG